MHVRHPVSLIRDIKKMRLAGFTLGEIKSKTGLSKTTIFHHIKSISKSDTLIKKIRLINSSVRKTIADNRRGVSLKKYKFLKPEKWSADFVNLVAHFLFDGQIIHTAVIYHNSNRSLIDNQIDLMKKVIGVSDYKTYTKPDGVMRVCYFHVEIAKFLKERAIELLSYIISAPVDQRTSILNIINKLLLDLSIKARVDLKYFEIRVTRRANLIKFQKLINFSPGVRVNGQRSNSVWKESLEKREILNRAINSYLN